MPPSDQLIGLKPAALRKLILWLCLNQPFVPQSSNCRVQGQHNTSYCLMRSCGGCVMVLAAMPVALPLHLA